MRASLRIPGLMLWLSGLWVALWGSVTWANVLGGLAVAGGVVLFARLDQAPFRRTHFRPHWALWYILVLSWQLLMSNIRLAIEIITPGDGTHTSILAVPIRGGSDAIVNLVSNSITLTPGTMTLDVKRNGSRDDPRAMFDLSGDGEDDTVESGVTLYVHSMYAQDVEAVRHDILRLEALALRAFGTGEDYRVALADVVAHEPMLVDPDRAKRARPKLTKPKPAKPKPAKQKPADKETS